MKMTEMKNDSMLAKLNLAEDATKQELHELLHDFKKREEGEAMVLMGIENGVINPNYVFEDYDEARHPHPQVLITLASGHKMVFTFNDIEKEI
tara:strand:- start:300 stop:578 length:279 start_codon:yes stop_codon:yes gene_type:complete